MLTKLREEWMNTVITLAKRKIRQCEVEVTELKNLITELIKKNHQGGSSADQMKQRKDPSTQRQGSDTHPIRALKRKVNEKKTESLRSLQEYIK